MTFSEAVEAFKNIKLDREISIMEVCGTHTMQFFHTGVKDIFPEGLTLIDGPGCPVCVTSNAYLDRAIEIGKQHDNVVLASFGDMFKVPSSHSSLQMEKGDGRPVEIVYSPMDSLKLAIDNPDMEIVFLSIGFETTIPTEALTVKKAIDENVSNFSILAGNKLTPPAVEALLNMGDVKLDGFILPGHVSIITGSDAWEFINKKFGLPSVIAGFEAKNLVFGTMLLLDLILSGKSELKNEYTEVVSAVGNMKARESIYDIFESDDAEWRGIGVIPNSGLKLKGEYSDFDAAMKFPVEMPPLVEATGCQCGDILRGLKTPLQCPLFGKKCTPKNPVGACMVSSEGSCAAYYKYHQGE